jgi:hypothetical protein
MLTCGGGSKGRTAVARKPVRLTNGKVWPSRGDAISYFRRLRDRHPVGTPILDRSDHDDLLSLLERYDLAITDGPSKIGDGVDHFETRINVTNGGRSVGFWAVRVDDTETDFSFIRAVNEAPKRELELLADACRGAVFPEVQSAKSLYFASHGDGSGQVACALTGGAVSERECALEYVGRPFGQLVKDYAHAQGWETAVPAGVMSQAADAQTTTVFVSREHEEGFRRFHRAEATIRVVSKSARLSRIGAAAATTKERYLEL